MVVRRPRRISIKWPANMGVSAAAAVVAVLLAAAATAAPVCHVVVDPAGPVPTLPAAQRRLRALLATGPGDGDGESTLSLLL